jgi:ABC-2 type transport system ATP-binding protein
MRIEQKFKIAATVLDDKVRMERKEGHRFITDLVESFPGEIQSISVSKPTLEDVFIDCTGHRFWSDEEQG